MPKQGYKQTKEHIELCNKLRPIKHGDKHPCWKGGLPKCLDCGKKLNQHDSKRCINCSNKKNWQDHRETRIQTLPRGEKHTNWKGGITDKNQTIRHSIEYKLWQDSVFARDGYTCQKTGEYGGKLVAHHIQNFSNYPELRLAIDNGITLGKETHKEFHRKYGTKNNTLEQIKEFIYGK